MLHTSLWHYQLIILIGSIHSCQSSAINATTSTNCCESIDRGEWQLVRRVTTDHWVWHPATDDLSGSHMYGIYDNSAQSTNNAFSILFNTTQFNQFLFAFGNCSTWLVTTKFAEICEYCDGKQRGILNNISNVPYSSIWYHREAEKNTSDDPLISLKHHLNSTKKNTIMYCANSAVYVSHYGYRLNSGRNVWIRFVENGTRYCNNTPSPTNASTTCVYSQIGPFKDNANRAMRFTSGSYGYDADSGFAFGLGATFAQREYIGVYLDIDYNISNRMDGNIGYNYSYTKSYFTKIKVSVFKTNSEMRHFIYNRTSDTYQKMRPLGLSRKFEKVDMWTPMESAKSHNCGATVSMFEKETENEKERKSNESDSGSGSGSGSGTATDAADVNSTVVSNYSLYREESSCARHILLLLGCKDNQYNYNIKNDLIPDSHNCHFNDLFYNLSQFEALTIDNGVFSDKTSNYNYNGYDTMYAVSNAGICLLEHRLVMNDSILILCFEFCQSNDSKLATQFVNALLNVTRKCLDLHKSNTTKHDYSWFKNYLLHSNIWLAKDNNNGKPLYSFVCDTINELLSKQKKYIWKSVLNEKQIDSVNWSKLVELKEFVVDRFNNDNLRQDMLKNGIIPDKNFVDLYTILPLTSQSNFDAYRIDLAFQETVKLILSKICNHNTNDYVLSSAPVKTYDRCDVKTQVDYKSKRFSNISHILDFVRCSIEFTSANVLLDTLNKFINYIDSKGENEFENGCCISEIVRLKNGFNDILNWKSMNNCQYCDVKLNVIIVKDNKISMIDEIQLLLKWVSVPKKMGHTHYSIVRKDDFINDCNILSINDSNYQGYSLKIESMIKNYEISNSTKELLLLPNVVLTIIQSYDPDQSDAICFVSLLYHIGKRSCDVKIFNLSSIYHFSQSMLGVKNKDKDEKDSLGKKFLIKYLNFGSGKRIICTTKFGHGELNVTWIDMSKENEYSNKPIVKDFGEKLMSLIESNNTQHIETCGDSVLIYNASCVILGCPDAGNIKAFKPITINDNNSDYNIWTNIQTIDCNDHFEWSTSVSMFSNTLIVGSSGKCVLGRNVHIYQLNARDDNNRNDQLNLMQIISENDTNQFYTFGFIDDNYFIVGAPHRNNHQLNIDVAGTVHIYTKNATLCVGYIAIGSPSPNNHDIRYNDNNDNNSDDSNSDEIIFNQIPNVRIFNQFVVDNDDDSAKCILIFFIFCGNSVYSGTVFDKIFLLFQCIVLLAIQTQAQSLENKNENINFWKTVSFWADVFFVIMCGLVCGLMRKRAPTPHLRPVNYWAVVSWIAKLADWFGMFIFALILYNEDSANDLLVYILALIASDTLFNVFYGNYHIQKSTTTAQTDYFKSNTNKCMYWGSIFVTGYGATMTIMRSQIHHHPFFNYLLYGDGDRKRLCVGKACLLIIDILCGFVQFRYCAREFDKFQEIGYKKNWWTISSFIFKAFCILFKVQMLTSLYFDEMISKQYQNYVKSTGPGAHATLRGSVDVQIKIKSPLGKIVSQYQCADYAIKKCVENYFIGRLAATTRFVIEIKQMKRSAPTINVQNHSQNAINIELDIALFVPNEGIAHNFHAEIKQMVKEDRFVAVM